MKNFSVYELRLRRAHEWECSQHWTMLRFRSSMQSFILYVQTVFILKQLKCLNSTMIELYYSFIYSAFQRSPHFALTTTLTTATQLRTSTSHEMGWGLLVEMMIVHTHPPTDGVRQWRERSCDVESPSFFLIRRLMLNSFSWRCRKNWVYPCKKLIWQEANLRLDVVVSVKGGAITGFQEGRWTGLLCPKNDV